MYNPTKAEVEQQLKKTETLVTAIDDTVAGRIDAQADDGRPVVGRNVQHGDLGYRILGVPGSHYLQVEAAFDAVDALVAGSNTAARTDGGQQATPMTRDDAVAAIRDAVDEEALPRVRVELADRLAAPGVSPNFHVEDDLVTGFTVTKRLWPFETDVTVSEFYETVQTVITLLWSGNQFLVHEYGLQDLMGGDGSSSIRGIQ